MYGENLIFKPRKSSTVHKTKEQLETNNFPNQMEDRNVTLNRHRERSKTWSNEQGDRRKKRSIATKPRLNKRSNSLAVIEKVNIAKTQSEQLMSQSYHGGQFVKLSVTNVDGDNDDDHNSINHNRNSKHRKSSRFSTPRNSVYSSNQAQSYHLNPRQSMTQPGKSLLKNRIGSRLSVASNDDSSSVSNFSMGPPKSAWEQFSEQIKELDDSLIQFTQHHRFYERSDTFVQCCSALEYKLPSDLDTSRKDSVDIEGLFDLPFSNEPRLSIVSTHRSTGRGRQSSLAEVLTHPDGQESKSR